MSNPSHVQKPNPVDLGDFRIPAAALAKARAEDVPTYCPTLFEEVLTLWKRAQNEAASRGSAAQIRKQLDEVMKKLGQASERATSSRDALSDLVRLRTDSQRNVWERYYAPEILIEAERYYWLAIREAENGKLDAAGNHADAARKLFRDATIQSLERGPIARLENKVIEAEQSVPQGRVQDAARELAGLRETLAETRQDNLTVSALRTRIIVGREAIRSLLALAPDLDPNWDVPFPPYVNPGLPEIGGTSPPDAPKTMRIVARTENSLTVGWQNLPSSAGDYLSTRGDINKLERQKENGPWELVEQFGHLNGWYEQTDSGLQPDTPYCYRVRIENPLTYSGSRTTLPENYACGYTRDGNNLKVWRAQFRICTANVSNAGTSADVKVLLAPSGNSTWLDYGPRSISQFPPIFIDDFDRGIEFTYDLDLSHISELSDITMLTIIKGTGVLGTTDPLGIAEIALQINGVEVFKRSFGETASTCLWISSIYTISHPELRADPSWQAYIASGGPGVPRRIRNEEMVSRLESMIGNAIHGSQVYWAKEHFYGPASVEATRLDDETLQVDLDLEASGLTDNAAVDIDFHLHFEIECPPKVKAPTLKITTSNVRANVSAGFWDRALLTLPLAEFAELKIAKAIEKAFQPISQTIVLNPPEGLCPKVRVDEGGHINFETS
jgi:hypothetical protein